jgi:hypothetical protein
MGRIGVSAVLVLSVAGPASAHRLDEYLQATLIGVTRNGIDVEIQMTPGVAILSGLMTVIDQDRDGRISLAGERAYVDRVVREVELRVDGAPAPLSVIESNFPTLGAMREGLGTIGIKMHTPRTGHELRFENRHLPQVSVFLVNCLATPADGLVVRRQVRDEAQKSIEFEYSFGAGEAPGPRAVGIALGLFWPVAIGMLLMARLAVLFYRAMHDKRASTS